MATAAAHLRPDRLRRAARALATLCAAALLLAVLVLGVFPTRTWLQQRADAARAEDQLDVLRAENTQLGDRIDALSSDAEIERLAREWYNLVRPGEEAYAVLPPPPARVQLPSVWPFGPVIEPEPDADAAAGVPRDE